MSGVVYGRNVRIVLQDTMMDAVIKLSEGNPGATTVCVQILNEGNSIDPDMVLGGFGILSILDTYNIYGSRIWMLFKDVCKQDLVKTIAALRACQMGLFPIEKLQYAIDNYGEGANVDELHRMVKERLPRFADIIDIVAEK